MTAEPGDIRPEELGEGTEVAVGSGIGEELTFADIPDALPVLPLKNTVLFPHLLSPLLVNSERSKQLIDAVLLSPHRLLLCAAVRHPVDASPLDEYV